MTGPLDSVLGDGQAYDRWFTVDHAPPTPSLTEVYADTATVRAAIAAELAPHGVDIPHIGASFLLGRTAWRVLGLLTVPYVARGLVPSLTTADIGMASLSVRRGEVARFRLRPGRVTIAAGAACACPVDATVVVDASTLRDELHRRSVGLLDGLIETLRPWARRSVRNQHAAIDDALATALWSARRVLGDAATKPRPVRRICCFAYQLEDGSLCTNCPLHPDNGPRAASPTVS